PYTTLFRSPCDDRDHVQRFDPEIGVGWIHVKQCPDAERHHDERDDGANGYRRTAIFRSCLAHDFPPRIRSIMRCTFSTGACGVIPCPRLKISGPWPRRSRMASTPSSRALPPATTRNGSRLPCTAPSFCREAAKDRGTDQSRPRASTPVFSR